MEVLLLTKKEINKFLKQIKHNRTHKRAIKKQGYCYALINSQKYFIELKDYWRKYEQRRKIKSIS